MEEEVLKSVASLKKGELILYPTDTVWGLGCDATDAIAVSKIFQLKKREESKSLVVLVSSLEMLKTYVDQIPEKVLHLLKTINKSTTIIYQNPKGLARNTIASDHTIAIRIPKHDFCKKLIEEFGKPIISTSANTSGEPTPKSFSEISQSILRGVNYIVNLERKKVTEKSSTILKLIGDEVQVIRP